MGTKILYYTERMEIIFTNQTDDQTVLQYTDDFEKIFSSALEKLQRPKDLELSAVFCTPAQIHEINKMYRGIDRPTDVISFAMQDDESNIFTEEEQKELGDIFINIQAAADQAAEYGHSVRREFCFLFCHGMLHLLGYDHMEPEDEKIMFALQDEILGPLVMR